jgi:hypothetical protein
MHQLVAIMTRIARLLIKGIKLLANKLIINLCFFEKIKIEIKKISNNKNSKTWMLSGRGFEQKETESK